MSIKYREGYKYQLAEDYVLAVSIKPTSFILTEYIRLDVDGTLSIKEGYAWDGPSGPTIDTPSSMRPSLVHDALYQLMREKFLDHEVHRKEADKIFRLLCIEDGMDELRADVWYEGLRIGGGPAADPKNEKPVIVAP